MFFSVVVLFFGPPSSLQAVLVYCKQGANRSACWALLVICAVTGEHVDNVYSALLQLRPIIYVEERIRQRS